MLLLASLVYGGHVVQRENTCTVHPSGNFTDDSPAIIDAFGLCGQGGTVRLYELSLPPVFIEASPLDRVFERDILDRESDEHDRSK